MAKPKIGKPDDLDTRIEDPAILREAFQTLFESETEFPIKVEGTHTLPYFSTIRSLHWDQKSMILKLVRPLPHELMVGAVFHFLCASGEQRYEGFIKFLGREGYLQYRFQMPAYLTLSDRRAHKRYPFRPRESAYVILQDQGIPGLGVAGPLVNIGMGGLALRVDRVLKLDTGYRVPPSTALFDRGKGFPRIRIQDLPRVHLLEVRGIATHATERGAEVILGVNFSSLQDEEEAQLRSALDLRDRLQKGSMPSRIEGGAVPLRADDGRIPAQAQPAAPAVQGGDDMEAELLKRLRRRTSTVALVMPDGPARQGLETALRVAGFHRLLVVDTLVQLAVEAEDDPRDRPPSLCLVDIDVTQSGDAEPLEAVRSIEKAVAALGPIPTVILCDAVDPTLLLSQAENTRFLFPELTLESMDALDELLEGQD